MHHCSLLCVLFILAMPPTTRGKKAARKTNAGHEPTAAHSDAERDTYSDSINSEFDTSDSDAPLATQSVRSTVTRKQGKAKTRKNQVPESDSEMDSEPETGRNSVNSDSAGHQSQSHNASSGADSESERDSEPIRRHRRKRLHSPQPSAHGSGTKQSRSSRSKVSKRQWRSDSDSSSNTSDSAPKARQHKRHRSASRKSRNRSHRHSRKSSRHGKTKRSRHRRAHGKSSRTRRRHVSSSSSSSTAYSQDSESSSSSGGDSNPEPTFSSDNISLHERVPEKLKCKIWDDEFVDFNDLFLASRRATALFESKSRRKKNENQGPVIKTILDWVSAFNVFAAIYLMKFSKQGSSLMHYLHTVLEISRQGGNWQAYDKDFRLSRAGPKCPAWHKQNSKLYTDSRLSAPPKRQQNSNSFPSHSYSSQQNSYSAQQNSYGSNQSNQQTFPFGTCYKFHAGQHCGGCTFTHACFLCDARHPVFRCSRRNGIRYVAPRNFPSNKSSQGRNPATVNANPHTGQSNDGQSVAHSQANRPNIGANSSKPRPPR